MTALDAALELAIRYPVHALRADKRPATRHGFKDASQDPGRVRAMFEQPGAELVGVPTGEASGLLVVDVDPEGMPWLEANEHRLPATRTHHTQRGRHLVYRYPTDRVVGCSTSKIAPGVDVRGAGGYVVWWAAHGLAVDNPDTATEAPAWLLEELAPQPTAPAAYEHAEAATLEELRELVAPLDPDLSYQHWLEVGMALHHEAGIDGLEIWNEWSSRGVKYAGREELERKWESFGSGDRPVTRGTLERMARAATPSFVPPPDAPITEPAPPRWHRFRCFTVDEFLAQPRPPWRVSGLFPKRGLVVVYGQPASGKSFWLLQLLAAIAAGTPFRGRNVQKARVCYIAAEGAGGFQNRLDALARSLGYAPDIVTIPAAPNLRQPEDVEDVIASIRAVGGAEVIAIDTLAQATPGANENAGEDMGPALRAAQTIAEAFDGLTILVHHSGKDQSKGARGWSGIKGALDAEIEITRDGDARLATVTKLKDGEDGLRMPFRLGVVELGVDEAGERVSSCVVVQVDDSLAEPRRPISPRVSPIQYAVLEAARHACGICGTATVDEVIDEAVRRMVHDRKKGRDRRREYAGRALETIAATGRLTVIDDRVRL